MFEEEVHGNGTFSPLPLGFQQPVAMTTHTAFRAQRGLSLRRPGRSGEEIPTLISLFERQGAGARVGNERPRCTSERTATEPRGKPEPRERTMLKLFVCTGTQAETKAGFQKRSDGERSRSALNASVSLPVGSLRHAIPFAAQ